MKTKLEKQRAEDGEVPQILTKYMLSKGPFLPLNRASINRAAPISELVGLLVSQGYGREQAERAILNGIEITFYLARFTAQKKYAPDGNNKWVRLTSTRFLNGKQRAA